MTPDDPLTKLRDIHLPAPISWWPPAPGWWLLAALLSVAALIAWYVDHRRKLRRRYRLLAIAELEELLASYQQHAQYQLYAKDVSRLLKRVAIRAFPQQDVAALSGSAWMEFLNKAEHGTGQRLPEGALDNSLYQRRIKGNAAQLHDFAIAWINRHQEGGKHV